MLINGVDTVCINTKGNILKRSISGLYLFYQVRDKGLVLAFGVYLEFLVEL